MESAKVLQAIKNNIKTVIIGKDDVIDLVLTSLTASGHVLIEDVPGLGKTTLVCALARSLGCSFSRIQFTPDVLPSDVSGYTVFDMKTGEKQVQHGGIMAQIVLADEINRTSPKTQASLLEAMQESQVTIDGQTYPLPQPFMVLATQNPIEQTGTYPLPEAQMDRFLMRLSIGYPTAEEERRILIEGPSAKTAMQLESVASAEDIIEIRKEAQSVHCEKEVLDYIIALCAATRREEDVALGISPRGSLALLSAARAYALLQGRDYVLPDDVQKMVMPVLEHRLVLKPQASFHNATAKEILENVLRRVKAPKV